MYKYILIVLLLVGGIIGCAVSILPTPTTISVAFINGNPEVTTLGLAKFILDEDGNKVDYKTLDIRWTDEKKVIHLEPGVYGVTQYHNGAKWLNVPIYGKIVAYQTFEVSKYPIVIEFRELF